MVTRLIVLGMLAVRQMTGYAIQQQLHQSRVEMWAHIAPGAIHHALVKLTSEGFVYLQATEQTGHRTKAIYAITEAGHRELRQLVLQAWQTPHLHFPAPLYAVSNFLRVLPKTTVLEALEIHLTALNDALEHWNTGAQAKLEALPLTLQPIYQAGFDNGRDHIAADIQFVHRLMGEVTQFEAPQ